jgi:hypothetical protein
MLTLRSSAEPSFATSKNEYTACHFAAYQAKNIVLIRLVELGVEVSITTIDGETPLMWASERGHLATAELLINSGAKHDDGSLHEAAREVHSDLIALLMTKNSRGKSHRVYFPSAIHCDAENGFGRTALEEMCLNASPNGDDWPKRLRDCVEMLLPITVKEISKSAGKTMLHLAIENRSAKEVLRELLSFPRVWENINDPVYLFQSSTTGWTYSPTKYTEFVCLAHDSEECVCSSLITLLHARKCRDRLYAHTVDQPDGACGLPAEIEDVVNNRLAPCTNSKKNSSAATRSQNINAPLIPQTIKSEPS